MENKIIDFRNKRNIVKIETEERFMGRPEVTLKITFDDNETLIMDLELLGEMTTKVSNELEIMEKRMSKRAKWEMVM